ncbi:MAG: hypothetical protein ACRDPW_00045 [Mycobacteriales bacterium]
MDIERIPNSMHLEERDGGVVAIPDVELPELTPQVVRETLEQILRSR